ncbi:MAG: hypothetical protein ACREN3_12960, partial [Gemmatimonadaceae bacterium]
GDEFDVFRARQTSTGAERADDPADPEILIGRAQAIRVTPYGTTALITAQSEPSIRVGMAVRLAARMP